MNQKKERKHVVYVHVSSGRHEITLDKNELTWKSTISSNMAPYCTNIPRSYFEEKQRILTDKERDEIFKMIENAELTMMKSDEVGGCFGASYSIFECIYSDGTSFKYFSMFKVPNCFNEIESALEKYCKFEEFNSLLHVRKKEDRNSNSNLFFSCSIKPDVKPLLLTSRGIHTKVGEGLIHKHITPRLNDKILMITIDDYGVNDLLTEAALRMGFAKENIEVCGSIDKAAQIVKRNETFDFVYVGEGNTFEIQDMLNKGGLLLYLNSLVTKRGTCYIGSSAGAILAGQDIELAKDFDKNFSCVKDFKGVKLFSGTVIPHYEEEEFIRYCFNTDTETLQNYKELFFVANDQLLVWDMEKTVSVYLVYFMECIDRESFLFFLEVMKNGGARVLVCDENDITMYSIEKIEETGNGKIHFRNLENEKRDVFSLEHLKDILKIYHFQDEVFGFRLLLDEDCGEKHIDMMISLRKSV